MYHLCELLVAIPPLPTSVVPTNRDLEGDVLVVPTYIAVVYNAPQTQSVVPTSQVPRPNLRCGSGERTPQELGKKLWSHITQKISMVIIKSWCLLENCTRGEATDVGVTHSSSSVAQQEAVLGHLPFATSPWQSLYYWICWFSSLVFATRSTFVFLASNPHNVLAALAPSETLNQFRLSTQPNIEWFKCCRCTKLYDDALNAW